MGINFQIDNFRLHYPLHLLLFLKLPILLQFSKVYSLPFFIRHTGFSLALRRLAAAALRTLRFALRLFGHRRTRFASGGLDCL